ncbi:hypothetical protein [Leptospira sp. GIMC2001]|uniref:hypothetical protein n=1 Tax=Leptospira sp. GIMC2001 TaxID=1513297 RepID=UPI00234BF749|nr:hypothetical protein [Leptospira sp. GIMC2001]WCL47671.1 hypothetical protein O4O04_01505 [Leptospira sp. GIMC2001]
MNLEKKIINLARIFRAGGKAENSSTRAKFEPGINISGKISALGFLVIFFSFSGSLYAQDDQANASKFHNSEVERIFAMDGQQRNSITMVEWEGQVSDPSPIILANEDRIQIQEDKPALGSTKSENINILSFSIRQISVPEHRVEISNSCSGSSLYVIGIGQLSRTKVNSPNFNNSFAKLNEELDSTLSFSTLMENLLIGAANHSTNNFSGFFNGAFLGEYNGDRNFISIVSNGNERITLMIRVDRTSKSIDSLGSRFGLSSVGLLPNCIIANSKTANLLDYKTFLSVRNSKLIDRQSKVVNILSRILSDTDSNASAGIGLPKRSYQEQNNIEKIVVFENISVWLPNQKESLSISSSLPCEDFQWKLMTTRSVNA